MIELCSRFYILYFKLVAHMRYIRVRKNTSNGRESIQYRLIHLSRRLKRFIGVGKQFDGAGVFLVRIRFTAD
jgi:hypothetical protein